MTAPAPARDRDRAFTWSVLALALATRVGWVLAVPPGLAWDGVLYERGAQAIARGLGYATYMFVQRSSDTVATAFYPVGYPAFIGALYAVFGARPMVLHLAGAAASALTVAVAHRLAWRVAPGWGARLAALALALMPGQILYAGAAMTEPLVGLLLALAVYALVRRAPAPARARDLVLAGLVLAAATYVRPQSALLAAVLPLARPSALAPGWRGRLLAALCTTGVVLACVLPWTARNCARLDGCAFVSTNGGSNLAIGAVPRATGRYLALTPADGCAGVRGEVARDRCWRAVAAAAIRRDPLRWLALGAVKLDHTLSYEAFPVGYLRESGALALDDARERAWRRALSYAWRALCAFALLALAPVAGRARLPDAARVALLATAVVLATHVAVFGGDRYHMPLAPLVAAVAAGALRELRLPFARRAEYPARAAGE